MTSALEGRCLCGAVRVSADHLSGEISACHCDMCRRWSGSVQMGIEASEDDVRVEGPVKVHRSSHLAERAWCDTCGSAVWFRYVSGPDTGYFELAPGLFDNAGGARLTREVYSDRCPEGYALAGTHERLTRAEYEAQYPSVAEGAP